MKLFLGSAIAINHDDAPITHVMRKAVSGKRKPGGAPAIFGVAEIQVSGPQTKNANMANIAVSRRPATRDRQKILLPGRTRFVPRRSNKRNPYGRASTPGRGWW